MLFALGAILLASCSRRNAPGTPARQGSLEQQVKDLEAFVNSKSPPINEAVARKEYQRDLAEIQSIGLFERAERDFASRITNVTIAQRRIGYFVDTNVVWCDFRYQRHGSSEVSQQEFGYARGNDTNWSLMWGVGAEPR
jgi:hypothetical protein